MTYQIPRELYGQQQHHRTGVPRPLSAMGKHSNDPRFVKSRSSRPSSAYGPRSSMPSSSSSTTGGGQHIPSNQSNNHSNGTTSMHLTNMKLVEKNNLLRKQLDRLQKSRQKREYQRRQDELRSKPAYMYSRRATIHNVTDYRQKKEMSYNSTSSKNTGSSATIEVVSISSDMDTATTTTTTTTTTTVAAGSGVKAVRAAATTATNSKTISYDSVENPEEGKTDDEEERFQHSGSEKSDERRTVVVPTQQQTSNKNAPVRAFRPASAKLVRSSTPKLEYPPGTSAMSTAIPGGGSGRVMPRPKSAAPRRKAPVPDRAPPRPVEAPPSTNVNIAPPQPTTGQSASTKATTSSSSASSQKAERARLQALIADSQWDGIGAPNCYVFGKLLGQGSFGTVRLCHQKITGAKVAIKSYEKAKFKDANQAKRVKQEIELMKNLNHVHIARLFESFETNKRIHLVMEVASQGNLCSYVKSRKRLPENEAIRIYYHILLALDYLHSNGIVHRDVKLENVLFDSARVVKLVDFGFSVQCYDRKLNVFCGTPSYLAPEITRRKQYNGFPVDMWSLGILLYAMLVGRFPFTAKTYQELYKKIARGVFQVPEFVSEPTKDVLRKLICLNPALRGTVKQMLKHETINSRMNEFPKVPNADQCTHLVSSNPAHDIEKPLIKQLTDFGFPEDRLMDSILQKKKDHFTTTYYLLAMKTEKKRILAARQRREQQINQQQEEQKS